MKNLQQLTGAKILNKRAQQLVKGGQKQCSFDSDCGDISAWECINGGCRLRYLEDKGF